MPADHGRVVVLGGNRPLFPLDAAHGDTIGEDDGSTVRATRPAPVAQPLRADGTWVVVNGDGTDEPPLHGLRP
ncbi:hypothetical protein [Streptomyces sp. NPDC049590]|uniref:hypothetical protein n=1 Tax=Streptomyces sp. NPDC049590 TaxID=3154834 RepID=UPI0034425AAE